MHPADSEQHWYSSGMVFQAAWRNIWLFSCSMLTLSVFCLLQYQLVYIGLLELFHWKQLPTVSGHDIDENVKTEPKPAGCKNQNSEL